MPGYSSYGAGVGNYGMNLSQVPDTTQREAFGSIIQAADPVWGGVELVYARAAGSIRTYGLVTLQSVWDSTLNTFRLDATEVTNTANLGRALAVAQFAMTAGQFGWFFTAGTVPVNCNASVAAGTTFGIAATGQGGANTAGKQVLSGVISIAASQTIVKTNCFAAGGSTVLQVTNSDAWFVGAYLSGTGIAGGTIVAAIDPSGRFVTLSAATTAAVTGSVTATYNNGTVYYNVAYLNRPSAQGAIT